MIKLGRAQRNKIEWLTNRLNRIHHDGQMVFSIQPVAQDDPDSKSKVIAFAGTNIHSDDRRWFHNTDDFYALIGPNGSIRKYSGTMNI